MMPLILATFADTIGFVEQSVADLSDEEMVVQPSGVPNHASWTLGHLISSCQGIASEIGGAPWLPDDWEARFGYGSTPVPDRSRYPSKAALLDLLRDAADRLTRVLSGLGDSALEQPVPGSGSPGMSQLLVQVVIAHTAFHAGQLAMWRRAIGKRSAAVFV